MVCLYVNDLFCWMVSLRIHLLLKFTVRIHSRTRIYFLLSNSSLSFDIIRKPANIFFNVYVEQQCLNSNKMYKIVVLITFDSLLISAVEIGGLRFDYFVKPL